MKIYPAVFGLVSAAFAANVGAITLNVSGGDIYYDLGTDIMWSAITAGSLEYDFSTGTGHGIPQTNTFVTEDPWGSPNYKTVTAELMNPDVSLDCLHSDRCNEFFANNLTLTDIGGGIIRWDAGVYWLYKDVIPAFGWVTLTALGNGQYRMNPYAYQETYNEEMYGWQMWNLYLNLTAEPSAVPLPPALWLLTTGLAALSLTRRTVPGNQAG